MKFLLWLVSAVGANYKKCLRMTPLENFQSVFFLCLSVWQIVHFQPIFSIYLVGCRVFFKTLPLLSLPSMFYEVSTIRVLLLICDLKILPEKRCPWWFIFCQLQYDISNLECEFIQAASAKLGDNFKG